MINIDDYKTVLEWPKRPERPAVLGKRVSELNSADLNTLGAVKAEYDAAVEAHDAAKRAYREDEDRLRTKFREDLAAEYGVVGNPREPKLWALAWSYGHSAGLGEVVSHYGELSELIVEAG